MTPAKKSPMPILKIAPDIAERASVPGLAFTPKLADGDAEPAPSGAHLYQAMLEAGLADAPPSAKYPPLARAAIVIGGGVAAWAAVIFGARAVFGLLS